MTSLWNIRERFLGRDAGEACAPPIALPRRDWKYVCAAALALAAVFAGLGLYAYVAAGAVAGNNATASEDAAIASRSDLTSVLSKYDARDTEHAALLANAATSTDPGK